MVQDYTELFGGSLYIFNSGMALMQYVNASRSYSRKRNNFIPGISLTTKT